MSTVIYHTDIEQGTDEWLKVRLGIVTASEVCNLITPKGKACKGEKVQMYACNKAAEREYGFLEDHYESFDMMRGHFQEGIAREVYNDNYEPVRECGFITNTINGVKIGASPDGLTLEGGIEIKSRLAKFQIKTIILDEVPAEYMNQIQFLLLITGRDWFDFVQYSNGLPLFVKRVLPDPVRQAEIMDALIKFEQIVVDMQATYKENTAKLIPTERVEMNFSDDVIDEIGE